MGSLVDPLLIGDGRPLLVVNGGPGLSKSYIVDGLRFLAAHRRCTFYDQLGSGSQRSEADVTVDAITDQLVGMLANVQSGARSVDIVCHSWGAFLLLNAIERQGAIGRWVGCVVFSNPMPPNHGAYRAAMATLEQRLNAPALEAIQRLQSDPGADSGRELMRYALPAYTGSRARLPDLDFDYQITTDDAIARGLGAFDVSRGAAVIADRLCVILGADDFVQPQHVNLITEHAACVAVIQDAGHFPFAERPDEFQRVAIEMLEHGA